MDDRDRHPHFFDSVGHGQMRAILDQRVRDGVIRRWLDRDRVTNDDAITIDENRRDPATAGARRATTQVRMRETRGKRIRYSNRAMAARLPCYFEAQYALIRWSASSTMNATIERGGSTRSDLTSAASLR